MAGRICTVAFLAWALVTPVAVAQNKSEKQEAARKLKLQVNGLLSDSQALADKDLERAYDMLHLALGQLAEPSPLSRDERLTLMTRVEKRMNDLRKQMSQSSSSGKSSSTASSSKKETKDGQVSPFFTNVSRGSFTPVVSGDRRSVRVGVRGTFSMVTPTGPMIPFQIPVPTFLYGPGVGTTAGRPEKIFQMFFPAPRGTIIRINSTATVPTDGFASLGGYSSRMEARNEFGVPIAGKTPYLGRLFRNIGYGSELTTHSIGISARVISMEEEEQRFLSQARSR